MRARQSNRYVETASGVHAGAYLPPLHAFSSRHRQLHWLSKPAFSLYGAYIPRFLRLALRDADIILIESGSALAFFAAARRLNSRARIVYFCRDLLQSIGAAPALQAIEQRLMSSFDLVCVPSAKLGAMLPAGGRVRVIPQGVDTGAFERSRPSPYPPGTRNAVCAGGMQFDQAIVVKMATAAPDVGFHIVGASWRGERPANVTVHPEGSFDALVPFIVHADFGIAPYRSAPALGYLAESSLKLAQYSYCRLPVVLPRAAACARSNAVAYDKSDEMDWRGLINTALAMPHRPEFRDGIASWDEIGRQTLDAILE
ncbi:glycosyltransferase [Xanthobacter autotrophicus NCIMB 11399]